MTIPSLPSPPNPSDSPAQFDALAFGFAAALDPWGQAVDAVGQQVADDAAAAVSAKDLAESARDTAVAAASAAESLAGASEWVSGTTYDAGDAVWSPIDYRTYRRKTPGAGTTDPSADTANWAPVVAQGDVTGPAGAVDGHVAVFDGVTGSQLKDGGKALPAGAIVGTTDAQTITGKTISYADNTLTGVQPTIVSGTHVRTVAGKSIVGAGNVDLVRADVGLGNVDNTSDSAKPISTATQAALNGKANVSHTHAIADVTGLQAALDAKLAATGGAASGLVLNDGYTEEVFAITDGSTVNLSPNNGSIQTWTLGANRTPGQTSWSSGQSITLLIDDGSARTINWGTLAVAWQTDGGTAPALKTSGYTVVVLWKVGSTIYGARVGDA